METPENPKMETPDNPKKRKFAVSDIIPLAEQHNYVVSEMDSDDVEAVMEWEKEENERVERTLIGAAYKLYKFRTCKSQVSEEEWLKLIGGRILTKK